MVAGPGESSVVEKRLKKAGVAADFLLPSDFLK